MSMQSQIRQPNHVGISVFAARPRHAPDPAVFSRSLLPPLGTVQPRLHPRTPNDPKIYAASFYSYITSRRRRKSHYLVQAIGPDYHGSREGTPTPDEALEEDNAEGDRSVPSTQRRESDFASFFPSSKALPTVPWGPLTVVGVMSAWLACFYVSYRSIVPTVLLLLGLEHRVPAWLVSTGGSPAEALHALRHVVLDSLQLLATLLLLHRGLRQHEPRKRGLFRVTLRPVASWLPLVLLGFACFPGIEWLHARIIAVLSGGGPSPEAAAAAVTTLNAWPLRVLWLFVLSVAAPVWEEYMFRGFLLPSLAKYMSPSMAVAISSSIFMVMHFSRNAFPAVFMLGVLCGVAYLRSLNLLPCILLHSGWNAFLLLKESFRLAAQHGLIFGAW